MKPLLMMRLYYGVIALLLSVTLIAQCFLTASEGRSLANTFSFFTIQSNVLVLITSAMLAIWPNLKGTWWRVFRLMALVGITVTGIVYMFLLAKYVHLTGVAMLYNYVFHYVVPIATVVGFFLFERKHNFKRIDFLFTLWPIAWLMYTMVRGAYFNPQFTGFSKYPSNYPYPFLDVTRTPMLEIITSIGFVCALIVGVGILYVYLDSRKSAPEVAAGN